MPPTQLRNAGTVVGLLLALGTTSSALAQSSPLVIPYSGSLDYQGEPVTGNLPMNFALFDCDVECGADPIWVASSADPDTLVWPDTGADGIAVPVAAGRFALELGGAGQPTLPDDIARRADLYLAIAVETDGGPVVLGGRQRVSAAVRAIRADEALDFEVHGDLRWGGNGAELDSTEGGSIELGASNTTAGTGAPRIDFHYAGETSDFSVRLVNDGADRLALQGGGLTIANGSLTLSNGGLTLSEVASASNGFLVGAATSGLRIETGTVSVTESQDYSVTFSQPFNAPPTVVFGAFRQAGYAESFATMNAAPTTTGFSARLVQFHGDWSRGAIYWVAIGH